MNAAAVLLAPWRSSQTNLRWLVLAILVATAIASIALIVFGTSRDTAHILTAMTPYAFGLAYACAFLLSTLLILAADTRKLRIPGVPRIAGWSAVLYGVFGVGMPCTILAAFGLDVSVVAVVLMLAACAGLAFVLLPRYVAVLLCFLPSAHIFLRHLIHLPEMTDPRWLPWGLFTMIALLTICALRWRQLLGTEQLSRGWAGPMLANLRYSRNQGQWGFNTFNGTQFIRQRPDWLQARPDLRKTGPRWSANSLRVALGRWYVPQTTAGHALQAIPWLFALAAYPVIMAFFIGNEKRHLDISTLLHSGGLLTIGWTGVFGAAMLAMVPTVALAQFQRNTNAELPLLALLPGLGEGSVLRASLLRAAFVKPGVLFALLLILISGIALWLHLGTALLACISLAMLGCIGTSFASTLCEFGGCARSAWGRALQVIAGFCLLLSTTSLSMTLSNSRERAAHPQILFWLIAAWLVFDVVQLLLGIRGWRGFVQRPHPFLPNDN